MPSVYDLKPKFQSLLRPLTRSLARHGVTANQVTLLAALLSLLTGAVLVRFTEPRCLLLLPVVLALRMALNAIDGMLAREHNQKSSLGAILNELGDGVSDSALYLPLALWPGFPPGMVVLIVVLLLLGEMTGVVGVMIGASRRYDGPMGKSDRAVVFGGLGLLLGLNLPIVPLVPYVLCLVAVLLILTIFNRARSALAELRGRALE